MLPARACDVRLEPGPEHLHGRERKRAGHDAERRPARRVPERGARAAREQGDDARIDDRVHRIGRGEHRAHEPVGHVVGAQLGPAQAGRGGGRQGERIGRAGQRHRQHLPAEPQPRAQRRPLEQRCAPTLRRQIGEQPAPAEHGKQGRGGELQHDEGEHAARERQAGDDHRRVDDDLDARPAIELLRRLQVPGRRPAEHAGERGDRERVDDRMRCPVARPSARPRKRARSPAATARAAP